MQFYFSILGFSIVYPIAYFCGFKLRSLIPKGKGFEIGFSLTLALLVVLFVIDLIFSSGGNFQNVIGIAFAIGAGHGIMFMEPHKEKIFTDNQVKK